MSNKKLYIIRGLPGTGKSTLAYELTDFVCEADMFFTKFGLAPYEFDVTKLREAHIWCQDRCNMYMREGITRIAVSNTGSQRWEIEPYVAMAQKYGYRITEITLTGDSYGSIHNVPDEAVERMKGRWEK